MPLSFKSADDFQWTVRKIAVIGPGIVGMPMAALLAQAEIREGSDEPAKVVVVQRDSRNSGWKVDAINQGRSVIGGVEPGLDDVVAKAVQRGILSATHDYADVADADLILVSVQTDKDGLKPDYGPLHESLDGLAAALAGRPAGNVPVIVFESTLAPSSMTTVVREQFARHGLVEGRDVLLGNSPNRVMPGRLVERVAASDKLVAGLHPLTPKLIRRVYRHIVTGGTLHQTNSLSAEFVKTLENAYRDVRIAFAAELVRECDRRDIDFYAVRNAVNAALHQADVASGNATAVPTGAILIPMIGVGGHCLPKDGILLSWRRIESGADMGRSLILAARAVNDASPAESIARIERAFGPVAGRAVTLLGAAYRFDSEDTRNSPTLVMARQLLDRGARVVIQDPYVKPDDQNLRKFGLTDIFTNDEAGALAGADVVVACVGHDVYARGYDRIIAAAPRCKAVFDGGHAWPDQPWGTTGADGRDAAGVQHAGIGRGRHQPEPGFVAFVTESFRQMERGVANELVALIDFLNARYAPDEFNRVTLDAVRTLAGSCVTGCAIAEPGPIEPPAPWDGFSFGLVDVAAGTAMARVDAAAGSDPARAAT